MVKNRSVVIVKRIGGAVIILTARNKFARVESVLYGAWSVIAKGNAKRNCEIVWRRILPKKGRVVLTILNEAGARGNGGDY